VTAVPTTPGPPPPPADPPIEVPVKPPNNLIGTLLLTGFLGGAWLLDRGVAVKLMTFVVVMLGWVLSVMAHEFCHALTAYAGGDHTVRAKGYLAFDPRRYGDLGTSVVLPLIFLAMGGIGFPGGAVYIRNDLLRGPLWRAAAALAGPVGTFVVLAALSAVLNLWSAGAITSPLYPALAFLAFLQATALILNLLPVPGLDGFGVIRPFLPASWTPNLRRAEGLIMVAMFLLIFFSPVGGRLLFGGGIALASGLGVPIDGIQAGYDNFHFWR
jgi:Zn-dependent protease